MTTPQPATRTIAGHDICLPVGKRYRASRPVPGRWGWSFSTVIYELVDGTWALERERIDGLSYQQADRLETAFNRETFGYDGRLW